MTITRMTASWAASAPVGEYTDPSCTGLQLRVRAAQKGLTRTWLFRYKYRQRPLRITLGHLPQMPLADARARAMEARRQVDDGIDPRRARPRRHVPPVPQSLSSATILAEPHSIEALASAFMTGYVERQRKNPADTRWLLGRDVLREWKGRDARTITPPEVIHLLDAIVARGAPTLANRTASLLSLMFKYGIQRQLVAANPVQLLFRPGGTEKPRSHTLSDDELKAYLKAPRACTRRHRLAHTINILLLTGQRRGELAKAQWSEIDFEAKTWTIPTANSKNRIANIVPLSDAAVKEFEALRRLARRSPWVLPKKGNPEAASHPQELTRSVARCQKLFKKAGIAAFTPHDLRRTCRTGLAKLGVRREIAERVLNHVQGEMIETYDRYEYLPEKRDALDKWANYLAKLAV